MSIAQAPGYVAVGSTTFHGRITDDDPEDDGGKNTTPTLMSSHDCVVLTTSVIGFANSLGCLRVWDSIDRELYLLHPNSVVLWGNRLSLTRSPERMDSWTTREPHLSPETLQS